MDERVYLEMRSAQLDEADLIPEKIYNAGHDELCSICCNRFLRE